MRGIGLPQKQIGDPGLGVSGAPVALPMLIGPIEIGNRHSQHTSVTGFTKRPVQDWADAVPENRTPARTSAAPTIVHGTSWPDPPIRARPPRPAAALP